MNAGDAFVLAKQHQDIDDHLWVILSDPQLDKQKVLLVSITTLKSYKDQACIIEREEHDWLTRQSCVAYDFARIATLDSLNQLRDSGKLTMKSPVSPSLLARMRRSVADSKFILMDHAELLIEQGLLDI